MKILITGGCGYIGCSVIDFLVDHSSVDQIILYDNLSKRNHHFFLGRKIVSKEKIRLVQGEILNTYRLEKEVNKVDIVIHLAAKVSTPFADNNGHEFDQINNWGTSILSRLVEKSPSVKKIIYLSSISVYGNTRGELVSETSNTAPKSFYGISKLRGEKHILRLNNINKVIIRLGNVYGYNASVRLDSVINKFIFDAHFKNIIQIHGSGHQKRPFTHIDTVGKYILLACLSDKVEMITNLVDFNLSINEIASRLKVFYPKLNIIHIEQHLEMRSITANSIYTLERKPTIESFERQLSIIKNQFSF